MRVMNNLSSSSTGRRTVRESIPAMNASKQADGMNTFPESVMPRENGANNANGTGMNGPGMNSNDRNITDPGQIPVIPLPNPGEGGPVYPGDDMNEENQTIIDPGQIPVIPLPNPGEGGPVYPGNNNMGNNQGNNIGNNQGNFFPTIPGSIIITYPRPNENCSFCVPGSNRNGKLRFLNATTGYNPFWIYINDKLLVNDFGFGDITEYVDVAAGDPTITLMGENGYVYLQQPVNVKGQSIQTIAIVNSDLGLALKIIPDENCERTRATSCVRVGNLSYRSGPLNLVIGNRYVTFRNVNQGEITEFATIWPGEYSYTVSRANNAMYPIWGSTILLQSVLYLQRDKNYTIYLFQYNPSADAIKAVIVED